ncbi:hypothetical protein N300_13129, partial [Calypte anna]
LAAEAVEGASLPLQGVHYVHSCHRLPLGMLGVRHSIADHVLQEHLQHPARLFVDQPRDALHTATPSKATDGWLGDALDVVPQHLTVALSASLAEPLPALA